MNKLQDLIQVMKNKDHFECLEELSAQLARSSEIVKTIGRCMELEEVGKIREDLPKHLVEAFILVEVSRVKLSVLAEEWNNTMSEVTETMINENKPKEIFDTMDF